jgi:arylsulfatase A-like enzyme
LLPALVGQSFEPRTFLYREFGGYGGQQAIWSGRWKAVRQHLRQGPAAIELYDLEADPGETMNLAAGEPKEVARLDAIMIREHQQSAEFPLLGLDGDTTN